MREERGEIWSSESPWCCSGRGIVNPGAITSCPCWCPAMEREMGALELISCYEVCSTGYISLMPPTLSLGLHCGILEHLPDSKVSCGVRSAVWCQHKYPNKGLIGEGFGSFSLGIDLDSSPLSWDEFILPNDLPTSQVQGILVWVIVCWSVFALSPDTNILNKSHSLLSWRYKGNIPQGQR